jgi:hypothetical protein
MTDTTTAMTKSSIKDSKTVPVINSYVLGIRGLCWFKGFLASGR